MIGPRARGSTCRIMICSEDSPVQAHRRPGVLDSQRSGHRMTSRWIPTRFRTRQRRSRHQREACAEDSVDEFSWRGALLIECGLGNGRTVGIELHARQGGCRLFRHAILIGTQGGGESPMRRQFRPTGSRMCDITGAARYRLPHTSVVRTPDDARTSVPPAPLAVPRRLEQPGGRGPLERSVPVRGVGDVGM